MRATDVYETGLLKLNQYPAPTPAKIKGRISHQRRNAKYEYFFADDRISAMPPDDA